MASLSKVCQSGRLEAFSSRLLAISRIAYTTAFAPIQNFRA
jgi:hypothetical protein